MATNHRRYRTSTSALSDITNLSYPNNTIDPRVQPTIQANIHSREHIALPKLTRNLGHNNIVNIKRQKHSKICTDLHRKTIKYIHFDFKSINKNISKIRLQDRFIGQTYLCIVDHNGVSLRYEKIVPQLIDTGSSNDIAILSNKMDKMKIKKCGTCLNLNRSNEIVPRLFNYVTINDIESLSNNMNTMKIDKCELRLNLNSPRGIVHRIFEDDTTNYIAVLSNKMNIMKINTNNF